MTAPRTPERPSGAALRVEELAAIWEEHSQYGADYTEELLGHVGWLERRIADLEQRRDQSVMTNPGLQSGRPCLGGTRLPVDQMAESYWYWGWPEVGQSYEIDERRVALACWHQATFGSRTWKQRWGKWAEQIRSKLVFAESVVTVGDLPTWKGSEARQDARSGVDDLRNDREGLRSAAGLESASRGQSGLRVE